MKPFSRISSAQYSPRRQSRWVLADYGGKDLWKRWVLSQEWNSEFLMDGESGEQEGGVKKMLRHQQSDLCKADGQRSMIDRFR